MNSVLVGYEKLSRSRRVLSTEAFGFRMLMSKIVNNDVSKDATIVTCLLRDRYDRIWEIRDMESAGFLRKKKFTILFH